MEDEGEEAAPLPAFLVSISCFIMIIAFPCIVCHPPLSCGLYLPTNRAQLFVWFVLFKFFVLNKIL